MGPSIIDVFLEYWPMFLKGALGTLRFAAIAVAGGTVLGTLIAILCLSNNKILNFISTIYVDVLRGTPLLVQMYISYFFLPMVITLLIPLTMRKMISAMIRKLMTAVRKAP